MTQKVFRFSGALVILATLFFLVPAAEAGPPLICWPFEIGSAKSLPWEGPQWSKAKADYDLNRLVGDTLALLTPETPVIVRMETLRRATVYAMRDAKIGGELLARLQERVRTAEAKGKPDALALFDAGYLVETFKQAGWAPLFPGQSWKSGNPAGGLDGYAMVARAIKLRDQDAEMEFAAALITSEKKFENVRDPHVRRAMAGAAEGSLLAKNLVTHAHLVGLNGKTMAELRAGLAAAKY